MGGPEDLRPDGRMKFGFDPDCPSSSGASGRAAWASNGASRLAAVRKPDRGEAMPAQLKGIAAADFAVAR